MDLFTKNKYMGWAIIGLVALNLATIISMWAMYASQVDNSPAPADMRTGFRPGMIEQEAGFTDQQLAEFQQLRQHHHSQMMECRNQITGLRLRIIDEIFSPMPNHIAIDQMIREIGALQAEAEKLTADHIHNVLQMSNPEQRVRLKELFRSMMNDLRRPHHRMGPGRGKGYGPGRGMGPMRQGRPPMN